ncbi:MAG: metallophosphoesterase [Thomasclavelia ramosa]|nr:metallophosphoesterase [Thomasclavelia ramosa]
MIYITGDTHGDFTKIDFFCKKMNTTKQDIIIILGDAGINYYLNEKDEKIKRHISNLPITLFCVHGNHEARPEIISSYELSTFLVGKCI